MKLNEKALAGSVQSVLLDHLKTMRCPWAQLSEAEQQAHIDTVGMTSVALVEEMIDVITETGASSINATVGNVVIGDATVSAKITILREEENSHLFQDAAHGPCKLSFANSRADLVSLGDQPQADPDQRPMFEDDPVVAEPVAALPKSQDMPESTEPKPAKKGNGRRKSKPHPGGDNIEMMDLAGAE